MAMAPKLNKKIIINVTGVVIVLALAAAGYLFYAGPRLKEWRDSVGEIKKRQGRLKELRKLFNEQDDPNHHQQDHGQTERTRLTAT